jgi:hypothetical protein
VIDYISELLRQLSMKLKLIVPMLINASILLDTFTAYINEILFSKIFFILCTFNEVS